MNISKNFYVSPPKQREIRSGLINFERTIVNNKRYYYNNTLYNDGAEYLLWLYFVLEDLFNGKDNMYRALYQMKEIKPFYLLEDMTYNHPLRSKNILLLDMIYLLDRKKIGKNKKQDAIHQIEIANLSFSYRLGNDYYTPINIETNLDNMPIPFWNIFITAFKEVDNIVQYPR